MARGERSGLKSRIKFMGEQLAHEILHAYPQGAFPMAQSGSDLSYDWYRPEVRGIIPLDGFHASKSLKRFVKKHATNIDIKINSDFEQTMRDCAMRDETWISEVIIDAFVRLANAGYAYALTVDLDGQNIGGIYGLAIGRAFFGESMYSKATNGSKLSLWALVELLQLKGFELLDTQYLTDHLQSLGGIEVSADHYQDLLLSAVNGNDIGIGINALNSVEASRIPFRRNSDTFRTHGRDALIGTTYNPDIITRMIKRR